MATLSELKRKIGLPVLQLEDALKKADELSPSLRLSELDAEDKSFLDHWFNRYVKLSDSQVANLRKTISRDEKHLALDLAALMRGGTFQTRAGLSSWFKV